jgi:hypothetical protein
MLDENENFNPFNLYIHPQVHSSSCIMADDDGVSVKGTGIKGDGIADS